MALITIAFEVPFRPALTSAEVSNGALPDPSTLDIAHGLKHDQVRAAFRSIVFEARATGRSGNLRALNADHAGRRANRSPFA